MRSSPVLHGADGNSGSDQFTGIDAPREAAERRLIEQDTAINRHHPRIGRAKINREIGLAGAVKQSSHLGAIAVVQGEVFRELTTPVAV
jgi:hypothetical protein